MKFYTLEEMEDKHFGPIGTPRRDTFESEVKEAIQAYHVGEAIKQARQAKNLTQEQLAELMGVKKAQISRIERGHNPTLHTITRAFNALGMAVSLTCGNIHIALG